MLEYRQVFEKDLKNYSESDEGLSKLVELLCSSQIRRAYSEHINRQLEDMELNDKIILPELDETIYME
ncbi:uncharacterized protein VNE69_08082 [Vairimorpha necatrix]|uniref:Uncharacterized protein n=1 Tax=Vairimorpha necatrix TaxID=6039 RepID=A0AAX4JE91_9MICR